MNPLHAVLAIVAAAAIVVGSITLLPEQWIDYGIMAGVLVWTSYVLISQRKAAPARRVLTLVLAVVFCAWIAFVLWPFNSPM